VAAQLGYCGLDRRHQPLDGSELRGCWDPGPSRTAEPAPGTAVPASRPERSRPRDFVPVELLRQGSPPMFDEPARTVRTSGDQALGQGDRGTLFGDFEA